MASPHAAGTAALAWASNLTLSNVQVRTILQQTAESPGLPANHQGHGLVRANLAVAQALDPELAPAPVMVAPPAKVNWALIGGAAAGVIVLGLLVYFSVVKRRRTD